MAKKDEIAIVARESGLGTSHVEGLLAQFGDSYQRAAEIVNSTKDLVVTNEDQTLEMSQARTKRLELKNIRIEVEKTRKALKEQSLREGKAIDGIANIIKAIIVPAEEHLELQEKFAELQEKNRLDERFASRTERLRPFVKNTSIYQLYDMGDDEFEELLVEQEVAFNAAEKAAKESAERERIEAEERAKENERIRKENARLKAEADAKEEAAAKERAEAQAKLDKERADNEAKLEAERKEREALERKERERLERELETKRMKEEKERRELLAPDRQKIQVLAVKIQTLELPEVKSESAKKLITQTAEYLGELGFKLTAAAEKL